MRAVVYQNYKLYDKMHNYYKDLVHSDCLECLLDTITESITEILSDGKVKDLDTSELDYLIYIGEDFKFLERLVNKTKFKFSLILPMSDELDYKTAYASNNSYLRSISIIFKSWLDSSIYLDVKHMSRLAGKSWNTYIIDDLIDLPLAIDYIENNYL